jgi:ubiquinone/menaquinone biosynthesis C-methylase UbiE
MNPIAEEARRTDNVQLGVMPTAKQAAESKKLEQLKSSLRATWSTGDYDRFSRYMEKDAEDFFRGLPVVPGNSLLDVGCGAGQLALIAARAGLRVSACDIATNWLDQGRKRAAEEGLEIAFEEGDAESLPYQDSQFDVVVSLIGAMFAPRPDLVASELTRVCRPGGIVAMANWTPGGFVGQMFKIISKYIAHSGMPAPALWGDQTTVRNRLREGIAELRFATRIYHFDYPFPPEGVVDFFRANYGPMSRAFSSLDEKGQKELRSELVQLWSKHNYADDGTTKVDTEYLEVIAVRDRNHTRTIWARGEGREAMSLRANSLARRIEEGADILATFAQSLTEAEWHTAVSATDPRSIGVIVHHVASVYPIEIELAKAIARGKAVTEVTWEAVAELNAKHASEQSGVSKASALELLHKNSREAANAVRRFSDNELNQAAPFSLSFGAPVTAQFVIEDHALRHSWHHLAAIRKRLGR